MQLQSQHAVVYRVVSPSEVKGQQDELLGGASFHRAASGFGLVPVVLNLLDKTSDLLSRGSAVTKSHQLRRDQAVPLD